MIMMYDLLKDEIEKILPSKISVIAYGDAFLIELDKAFSKSFFERLREMHPECRLWSGNRLIIGNVNHDAIVEFFKRFKYPSLKLFIRTQQFFGRFQNEQLLLFKRFPKFEAFLMSEPFKVFFCSGWWLMWSQYCNSKKGYLLKFDEDVSLDEAYQLAIKSLKPIANDLIETYIQLFNPEGKNLKEILMSYRLGRRSVGNIIKNTRLRVDLSEYPIPDYMKLLLIRTFPTRFS